MSGPYQEAVEEFNEACAEAERLEELARKHAGDDEDFGSWKDDYADAVGISRTKEL